MSSVFDLCIVGAGMMGSSAARHAVTYKTATGRPLSVCLVGPEEPKIRQGHTIFGAYFDEGRITLSMQQDIVWAALATRSIARYRQLESQTGIQFYHDVGCLAVGDNNSEFLTLTQKSADEQGVTVMKLDGNQLKTKYPYLGTDPNSVSAILETNNSGYINPRQMRAAFHKFAQNHGCKIIQDVVNSVSTSTRSLMKVTTDSGQEILADKVLLAPGAFIEFRSLLTRDVYVDLVPLTQAVIFAELSQEDLKRCSNMPSLVIHTSKLTAIPVEQKKENVDFQCYILPPIKYPDGKYYIKLGHESQFETPLKSPEEITSWYLNPPSSHIEHGLRDIFHAVFPDLKPLSMYVDTCVTTHTPTSRPYLDLVSPQLGVALGGNGHAAKSCDEIGRLAADLLLTGTWNDHHLSRNTFELIVKQNKPVTAKL